MLGFGKATKSTPADAPQARDEKPDSAVPGSAPLEEDALESLGFVLRALGRGSFAVEDLEPAAIAARFEAWASHLLVRAPHPEAPESERPAGVRPDFAGLRRFVTTHRKREQAYVQGSVDGLRDAVWAFARSLNRVLGEGTRAGAEVDQRIRQLREAAERPSTEDLRREVLAAAESIESIVGELRRRQQSHADELGRKVRTLTEQLAETQREVGLDALTRLANRKALDAHLGRLGDLAGVLHSSATLLMIDLDHFKQVNDAHGHPTGDDVLRGVADSLSRTFLRKSDFVARYGGEEFVVILNETTLASAIMLADRFRGTLRTVEFQKNGARFHVTVSIGVAELQPGEAPETWVERADRALYEAKRAGRDRAVAAT